MQGDPETGGPEGYTFVCLGKPKFLTTATVCDLFIKFWRDSSARVVRDSLIRQSP
jgi:hypothetical protein